MTARPQVSLHDLTQSADCLISASAELYRRRSETQALRDLMLVTLARCCPELPPEHILAAAQQMTGRVAK
jgi:hypothetical protein